MTENRSIAPSRTRNRLLYLVLLIAACTRPLPSHPIAHPLTTPYPRTDANQWTREDFVACRVDTECLRRRR